MGAKRLFTRLKAFRDEHIRVEMAPLLFGVADIISDNPFTKMERIARIENINHLPIKVIVLHGTIFTKFDRDAMENIEDIKNFEHLQNQSARLMERMRETQPLIDNHMKNFVPMKHFFITDDHKVRYLSTIGNVQLNTDKPTNTSGHDWRRRLWNQKDEKQSLVGDQRKNHCL